MGSPEQLPGGLGGGAEHTRSEKPTPEDAKALSIAYIVGQYIAFNHAYLHREIAGMRKLGAAISVISINAPDRPTAQLTDAERVEAGNTFLPRASRRRVASSHSRMLLSSPRLYLSALSRAIRIGAPDGLAMLWCLQAFSDAVVISAHLNDLGVRRVHAHFASTVALMLTFLGDYRVTTTIHGPAEFEEPGRFFMREKCSRFARVIAISSYARSQVMRNSDPSDWDRILVIPLGVPSALREGAPPRRRPKQYELVTVARLAPVKGQRLLLTAVAALRDRGRAPRLTVVGNGPDLAALRAQAAALNLSASVTFAGSLPERDVVGHYDSADLFVLPSFAEGVPVVLMEAMSRGLPCVATRVAGVPELIEDERTGILVAAGDSAALAAAVERLLENPSHYNAIAVAAKARIAEAYDLDMNVRRLYDALASDDG